MAEPLASAPSRASLGTPEHFRWLHGIVKTVLVLNLLDAMFTLLWVRAGLAREANPMIDELVDGHALAFFAVKLGLVGMGSWLLWRRRDQPAAVVAIFVAFLAYYLVLLYHLQYAATLVRSLF
jgi:formate hydrogenlyase subunit 3/multisubunit Na+/H+ antiporter MnhD subunit